MAASSTNRLTGPMWHGDTGCLGAGLCQDAIDTVADFNGNPDKGVRYCLHGLASSQPRTITEPD